MHSHERQHSTSTSSEQAAQSHPRRSNTHGDAALRSALSGTDPFSRSMRSQARAHRNEVPGPLDANEDAQRAMVGEVMDLPGQGEPLPERLRRRFEEAMGHDLSHVRIHRSSADAEAARDLSARAFALGSDLFFGAGEYSPGTPRGDQLLAHELTHVVQHDQGRLPRDGGVSSPSEPSELEARAAEDRVTARLRPMEALERAAHAMGSSLFDGEEVEVEVADEEEAAGLQECLEESEQEEEAPTPSAEAKEAEEADATEQDDPDKGKSADKTSAEEASEDSVTDEGVELQEAPEAQGLPEEEVPGTQESPPVPRAPAPARSGRSSGGRPSTPSVAPAQATEEQARAVEERTGEPVEAHQAHLEQRLDAMSSRAGAVQHQLVQRLGQLGGELEGLVEPLDVGPSQDRVRAAFEDARSGLAGQSDAARARLEVLVGQHTGRIDQAHVDGSATIQGRLEQGQAELDALALSWLEPFSQSLDDGSERMEELGAPAAEQTRAAGEALRATLRGGGDPVERAENEGRAQAVPDLAGREADRARETAQERAQAAREEEEGFTTMITNLAQPMRNDLEERAGSEREALETSTREARDHLEANQERVEQQVEAHVSQGEDRLMGEEQSGVERLQAYVEQAATDLQAVLDDLRAEAERMGAEAGPALQGQLDRIAANAEGRLLTREDIEPVLAQAEQGLEQAGAAWLQQAEALFEEGRGRLTEMVVAQGAARDELTVQLEEGARASSQALGEELDSLVRGLDQGMEEQVSAVQASVSAHSEEVDAEVEAYRARAQDELSGAHERLEESLTQQVATLREQLAERVQGLPENLAPGLDRAAAVVRRDLHQRTNKAYRAMADPFGTNENLLMDALRGLTAVRAIALEHSYQQDKHENLRTRIREELTGFLDDVLDGRRYFNAAMAYLSGSTAEGASFELEACIRWYDDDEARVETILRGLDEGARRQLHDSPQFAQTREQLRGSLSGADLHTTEALLDNNLDRADAVRLHERLEDARGVFGDPEDVIDALQEIDPQRREAIAAAFQTYDLEHMREHLPQPPAFDAQGNQVEARGATLEEYALRSLRSTQMRGARSEARGDHESASEDVVRALAQHGRDSDQAAIARFQLEATRDGGPDWESMQQATFASQDLQQRLHSSDPQVREAAEEERDARRQRLLEGYEEQYGRPVIEAINEGFEGASESERDLVQAMLHHGTNTPDVADQMLRVATRGAGTDEDMVRRALHDLSPAEMRELERLSGGREALYASLGVHGRGGLFETLAGEHGEYWHGVVAEQMGPMVADWLDDTTREFTGGEAQEVEQLLIGRVETDRQRAELAMLQYQQQRGAGAGVVGNAVTDFFSDGDSGAGALLDETHGELRQWLEDHGAQIDGDFQNMDHDQRQALLDQVFDEQGQPRHPGESEHDLRDISRDMRADSQNYQAVNDAVTDAAVQGITTTAALATTAVTAGGASPLLAMALAGGAGLSSMGVREAMQGDRYGGEDQTVDLINTAASAGSAYLGGYSPYSAAFTSRLGQGVGTAVASGVRSAGTSAINTALQDPTWDDGAWEGAQRVGGRALRDGAVGAVSSTVENRVNVVRQGVASSMGQRGAAAAVGNMSKTAGEYAVDQATGTYSGRLDEDLLRSGARGVAEGMAQGGIDRGMRGRNVARRLGDPGADEDRLRQDVANSRNWSRSEAERVERAALEGGRADLLEPDRRLAASRRALAEDRGDLVTPAMRQDMDIAPATPRRPTDPGQPEPIDGRPTLRGRPTLHDPHRPTVEDPSRPTVHGTPWREDDRATVVDGSRPTLVGRPELQDPASPRPRSERATLVGHAGRDTLVDEAPPRMTQHGTPPPSDGGRETILPPPPSARGEAPVASTQAQGVQRPSIPDQADDALVEGPEQVEVLEEEGGGQDESR